MICPRCKNNVPDGSNFCCNCDWNFNYKKKERKRYETMQFENCGAEQIRAWLYNNADQIEILSVRGNLRFDTGWMLINTYNWYFQYLSIRYYPNTKGHKYNIVLRCSHNNLFNLFDATQPVDRDVDAAIRYSRNVIWDFYRDSHLPGGKWTYARAALYEC